MTNIAMTLRRAGLSLEALLVAFVLAVPGLLGAQHGTDAQLSAKPTPFPVCIDDSDCVKMGEGNKYACFQVKQAPRTEGSAWR